MILSIRLTWICIFAILLTYATALDEECDSQIPCQQTGTTCSNGKCRCNIPFYQPCNSTCDIVRHFAYHGDRCMVTENCIDNADCQSETCRCKDGFTEKNGACFRNLYTQCTMNKECWSNYCLLSECRCPPGYETNDNMTTCRRKLVNVYNTWDEANNESAFCQERDSCIDIIAICFNDTAHPQSKFCKCPNDFEIKDRENRRQCEPVQGIYLSPLETVVSNYGQCGTCADEHAACIYADKQKTCWCRAKYEKQGNKCEPRRRLRFVFPNEDDRIAHNFAAACSEDTNGTSEIKGGLCVCARGYEFDVSSRSCKKIEQKEYKPFIEYGLCTHINSNDQAIAENGICPEPFTCEPRNDKYVCSCGVDKFQDISNPTQCVYYIGKGAGQTNQKCPTNAHINASGNCECNYGYEVVNENRECKLELSNQIFNNGSCIANPINNSMCQKFGVKAILCQIGECRCGGTDSFPNKISNKCEAPLNQTLGTEKENCPSYSSLRSNRCECLPGYYPSSDLRECVRWSLSLIDYQGSPIGNPSFTTADCADLYGPAEVYSNNQCQCRTYAFVNEDKSGCLYKINAIITSNPNKTFCPSNSNLLGNSTCSCEETFKIDGNKCVRITDRVYTDGDPNAPNIIGIDNNTCVRIFGYAAYKSNLGNYCICGSNGFPIPNFTRCLFYINETSSQFKNTDNCPENSNSTYVTGAGKCICDPGYYASADRKSCDAAEIDLVGTEQQTNNDVCTKFANIDCTVKFGANAFCKNDQCYCNREKSFRAANGRCESYTGYKFPAQHDLYLHVCDDDEDCVAKSNAVCAYSSAYSRYKVCQCREGLLLNLETLTCENRCTNCPANSECQGYDCKCKTGYFLLGSECVEYPKLQLYERCNSTIINRYIDVNQPLVCNSNCSRAFCKAGYKAKEDQCIKYQLKSDRCIQDIEGTSFCENIDSNAVCNREINQCLCKGPYYPYENRCVLAVSYECNKDEQCGAGECKAGRCACRDGQRIEETQDADNRIIQYCVNGIDRLHMSWFLFSFLFLVWARLFCQ